MLNFKHLVVVLTVLSFMDSAQNDMICVSWQITKYVDWAMLDNGQLSITRVLN